MRLTVMGVLLVYHYVLLVVFHEFASVCLQSDPEGTYGIYNIRAFMISGSPKLQDNRAYTLVYIK